MNTINLTEILIANTLGVLMMSMLVISGAWKIRGQKEESAILLTIIFAVLFSGVADAISFVCDGRPGLLCYIGVFYGNIFIFLAGIILSGMWLVLVNHHINGGMSRIHKYIVAAIGIFGVGLCIATIFYPVIFYVDADNVYHRGPFCIFFTYLQALYYVDGIFLYFRAKKRGGVLKFFPVFTFLLPMYIGMAIQNMYYGISLVYPAGSVSICGMVLVFHNESIFRDPLTGLYNRYYLDNLKEQAKNPKRYHMTLIMMDMNQFKYINDQYGHSEGDAALNTVAGILINEVGSLGTAVRFAGDEFLILLNSTNPRDAENVIAGIRKELDTYNKNSGKSYDLSVSAGFGEINLAEQSVAEIMGEADKLMYEDKKKFYVEHPEMERRESDREVNV